MDLFYGARERGRRSPPPFLFGTDTDVEEKWEEIGSNHLLVSVRRAHTCVGEKEGREGMEKR